MKRKEDEKVKEVKISILPTEIKSLKFENAMTVKKGEQTKIQIKTGTAVKLNPDASNTAAVMVRYEALDESKKLQFELDTITGVTAEPAVTHLDEVIKQNYLGTIMLAVNEKVRAASMAVGLNLVAPKMEFKYLDKDESIDSDIFRTM